MSLVIPQDFKKKLYQNVIRNIDREKNHLVEEAIITAESEVKSSLHRYDIDALFSTTGTNRDAYLIKLILDVAVWELSSISSVQIDTEFWYEKYKLAVKALERIELGKKIPEGWPKLEEPENVANKIEVFSGRPQRSVDGL